MQDEDDQVENERNVRTERFKLPPIFQAAARPKNRTVDESEGLIRGQKARTFEQEKPSKSFVHLGVERGQKSPVRTVKQEAKSPRKDVLFHGAKEGKVQLEPLQRVRRKSERSEKSLEVVDKSLELDRDLYIVDTNKDGRKPKNQEKSKRRRRTKSPQKVVPAEESSVSNDSAVVATSDENTENGKENSSSQLKISASMEKDTTTDTKIKRPQHYDAQKVSSKSLGTFALSEGDMVAIKVPEKLYIKGQPCLGKITTLADHQGLLTVHYYTGSYQGRWRPMMSRTSPYLRKVSAADVLCKFKLSSDGRMSPITQRKLRTVVDDERNESGDVK